MPRELPEASGTVVELRIPTYLIPDRVDAKTVLPCQISLLATQIVAQQAPYSLRVPPVDTTSDHAAPTLPCRRALLLLPLLPGVERRVWRPLLLLPVLVIQRADSHWRRRWMGGGWGCCRCWHPDSSEDPLHCHHHRHHPYAKMKRSPCQARLG